MSRVQLALNVSDLEASIDFYSKLFNTTPHKLRPGYANFAIDEPALKLVLIEQADSDRGTGPQGALNHLGVEVETTDEVRAAAQQLSGEGVATVEEMGTTCCYAEQDKVWVFDPAGAPWEVYTVTDDNPDALVADLGLEPKLNDGGCCTPASADNGAQQSHAVPVAAGSASTCC